MPLAISLTLRSSLSEAALLSACAPSPLRSGRARPRARAPRRRCPQCPPHQVT